MTPVDKLLMIAIGVSDMPKAKAFYADTLGLKVTKDYRQDDARWWVSLEFPGGGTTITLTTYTEGAQLGGMTLWFTTADITASHEALKSKVEGLRDVTDDLYGPGSGVKWFDFKDPDGNKIHLVQA